MRQLSPTSSKTVNQASIWLLIAQFLVFSEQTAVGVAGSADSAASQASRQIPTLLTTALACSQLFLGYGSTELSALLWLTGEVGPKRAQSWVKRPRELFILSPLQNPFLMWFQVASQEIRKHIQAPRTANYIMLHVLFSHRFPLRTTFIFSQLFWKRFSRKS